MAPDKAYAKLRPIFDGCMQGKTMYIVPFLMGPEGSPFSKVGIEITDSVYVALNMGLMTRMGAVAMKQLGDSDDFTRGLHARAELDMNRRFICHFPQDNTIWSVGSGYGGNALLSKKCMALRLASAQGRKEGWLAEHMLIVGIESPEGEVTYIAGAFPSACGKTNLAMIVPPARFKGWKVWTVGDDIAWLRPGDDGRLYAVNPEAGFFGVAPGTGRNSNPNAVDMVQKNAIFTNVALKPDGTVWWEGLGAPPPECTDWTGQPWTPAAGRPAAHPNSRFTVGIRQNPSYSDDWNNPKGVPISAILFGARRARVIPLVYEAFNWQHRHLPRRDHGVGDDRRGDRRRRGAAPGSVRHAAFLRLQHGRLFRPLAGDRRETEASTARVPGELVQPGRGRQVPVARLRKRTSGSCSGSSAAAAGGSPPMKLRSAISPGVRISTSKG